MWIGVLTKLERKGIVIGCTVLLLNLQGLLKWHHQVTKICYCLFVVVHQQHQKSKSITLIKEGTLTSLNSFTCKISTTYLYMHAHTYMMHK